ncbi:MAG TPA: hypothetical protein VGR84_18900 [Candidatus Acidoferrales bacterium]|nr:hypothetical protein [Candidatus Acidoferrales bacterium]
MSLASDLDRLAAVLLQEALSASPPAGLDRLDVFKAISSYQIGMTRARKGLPTDPPPGGDFNDLRKSLEMLETTSGDA